MKTKALGFFLLWYDYDIIEYFSCVYFFQNGPLLFCKLHCISFMGKNDFQMYNHGFFSFDFIEWNKIWKASFISMSEFLVYVSNIIESGGSVIAIITIYR